MCSTLAQNQQHGRRVCVRTSIAANAYGRLAKHEYRKSHQPNLIDMELSAISRIAIAALPIRFARNK
jgi:hypothetical protein